MAKLTAKTRKALPGSAFAIPAQRKYPDFDRAHAADARSRVAHNGTPAEKAAVGADTARKFPGMGKKKKAAKRRFQGRGGLLNQG
jgi:hypothetical protein